MWEANGAANGGAEIVLSVDGLGGTVGVVSPAVGIQRAVTVVIVDREMEIIGARLQRKADYAVT